MLAIAKITTDIFLSSTDTFQEDANTRAVRLAGKDAAGAAAGTVLAGNNAAAAGPSSSSPAKTAHPNRRTTSIYFLLLLYEFWQVSEICRTRNNQPFSFSPTTQTFRGTVLPWLTNGTIGAANAGHDNNHTKAIKDMIVLKIFLTVAHPSLLWTKRFCCCFFCFLEISFQCSTMWLSDLYLCTVYVYSVTGNVNRDLIFHMLIVESIHKLFYSSGCIY